MRHWVAGVLVGVVTVAGCSQGSVEESGADPQPGGLLSGDVLMGGSPGGLIQMVVSDDGASLNFLVVNLWSVAENEAYRQENANKVQECVLSLPPLWSPTLTSVPITEGRFRVTDSNEVIITGRFDTPNSATGEVVILREGAIECGTWAWSAQA